MYSTLEYSIRPGYGRPPSNERTNKSHSQYNFPYPICVCFSGFDLQMHEWPSKVSCGELCECDGSRTLFYEDISLNAAGSRHNAIHIHNFNNSELRVEMLCYCCSATDAVVLWSVCFGYAFVESISHIKFKLDELPMWRRAQFTSFASETWFELNKYDADQMVPAINLIDDLGFRIMD